jgi:hypothetical protein
MGGRRTGSTILKLKIRTVRTLNTQSLVVCLVIGKIVVLELSACLVIELAATSRAQDRLVHCVFPMGQAE